MTTTISEGPWGGQHVRRRVRWRSTKTKRTCWWEFTNQPGNKDWHMGEPIYTVKTAPRGTIDVDTPPPQREDRHMFAPDVVERFLTDLVELSGESRRALLRRQVQ